MVEISVQRGKIVWYDSGGGFGQEIFNYRQVLWGLKYPYLKPGLEVRRRAELKAKSSRLCGICVGPKFPCSKPNKMGQKSRTLGRKVELGLQM